MSRIRAKQDTRGAQEQLYESLRELHLDWLRSRIPPKLRRRVDAEDVLDVAFMRAMNKLDSFQGGDEDSFSSWFCRIAKNHIIDLIRGSSGVIHFGDDDRPGPRPSGIIGHERRPESRFRDNDELRFLLAKLRRKEAAVIRMRDLDRYSFEEIAAYWQKSPDAVRRFYCRARQRLQDVADKLKQS